jgi:ribosomal protein L12E/L44/L45/RPP1/RPP2
VGDENMNYDPDSVKSIFHQRSKVVQEEFALIELMIEREGVMKRLSDAIKDVNDLRKELDDAHILKTFRLFNMLREVTVRFIKTVEKWQGSFTRFIRPELYSIDYMASKFLRDVDFINSSKLKKIFNFQFYRGNILLLPYPSGITLKNVDPLRVHPDLNEEIKKFSNPDEEDVIACYQVLINCLPEDVYSKRLVSLEKWLIEPWTPNIFLYSKVDQPLFTPEFLSTLLGASTTTPNPEEPSKPGSSKKVLNSKLVNISSSHKAGIAATTPNNYGMFKSTKSTTNPSRKTTKSLKPSSNLPDIHAKPSSSAEVESVKVSLDSSKKDEKVENTSIGSSTIGSYSYRRKEKSEFDPPLTVDEKRELRKLENYLKDVTSLLTPKAPLRSPSKGIPITSDTTKSNDEIFMSKQVFFAHIPKQSKDDESMKKDGAQATNALALSSKKNKDLDEVVNGTPQVSKNNKPKISSNDQENGSNAEKPEDDKSEDEEEDDGDDEDDDDGSDDEVNTAQGSDIVQSVDNSTICSEQTMDKKETNKKRLENSTSPTLTADVESGKAKVNNARKGTDSKQKDSLPSVFLPKPSVTENTDIGSLMNMKPGDEETTVSAYSRKKKKRKHLGVTTAAMRAIYMRQKEMERQLEASKVKPLRLML